MTTFITTKTKYPLYYLIYLFAVWTIFRLSGVITTQELDEFVIKPIIWLVPVLWLIKKERVGISSLGITSKNLFPAIYLSLFLGALFTLLALGANYLKYGNFTFTANLGEKGVLLILITSFATAISEEVAFRGYIFNRFLTNFDNEFFANLVTSLSWVVIRIPATVSILGYGLGGGIVFLSLSFLYSVGACFIFGRSKNIFSTIFLHVLWSWPIILFR